MSRNFYVSAKDGGVEIEIAHFQPTEKRLSYAMSPLDARRLITMIEDALKVPIAKRVVHDWEDLI